jgi:hypothetical protein
MTFEQWQQSAGQWLPSGGSMQEYLQSGVAGNNPIYSTTGNFDYSGPSAPSLTGYGGTSSQWMTNPDTGKEGQLQSGYGMDGTLSNVQWYDKPDKNGWMDKTLNFMGDYGPLIAAGVMTGGALGLWGGATGGLTGLGATGTAAAGGAGTAAGTLGTAGAFTTPVAAPSALATSLYGGGTAAGTGLTAGGLGAAGLGGSAGSGLLPSAGGITGLTSAGTAAAAPATSLATTGLGGGGMGLWDTARNWATSEAGSSILGDVGSSLLQGYAGRQGAQANTADAQQNQQFLMDLAKLSADEARFKPVNVTNSFGNTQWEVGPDGKVTSAQANLSPEMQAYIAQAMGKGGQTMAGVSAGTPQEIAQAEFDRYKAFAAPKQMEQFEALQNRLNAQGLGGLGAGGGTGVNPFMRDFSKGVSEADYAAYKDAQVLGQSLTDSTLSRANTLFGQGIELDKIGTGMLSLGAELGGRGVNATGANAMLQAGTSGANSLLSAQLAGNKANTLFGGNAAAGMSPLLQAILQGMR